MNQPRGRYVYLDGLRGLACLMVALSHFVTGFYQSWFTGTAAAAHNAWDPAMGRSAVTIFYDPALGVAIFFILSGFVLANNVAAPGRPPWLALAVRRWVRLCLPIIAALILTYGAAHAGALRDTAAASVIAKSQFLALIYASAVYTTPLSAALRAVCVSFFTGTPGDARPFLAVLWTIPYELLGSLALFAWYCWAADAVRRWGGSLAVALLAVLLTWRTPYYGFALGIALFEIRLVMLARAARRPGRPRAPLVFLMLLAGLWLACTPYHLAGSHLWFWVQANAHGVKVGVADMLHAGAALLVAAVLLSRRLQAWLSAAPCRYLGGISYMLYLVQVPVLCSAGVFVFLHAGPDYNLRCAAALVSYLFVAVVLAEIGTRLFDRPAIALSRLVTASWGDGKRLFF